MVDIARKSEAWMIAQRSEKGVDAIRKGMGVWMQLRGARA